MSVISETKWVALIFLIVMSVIEGCDDEKKRWVTKESTDREVQSSQPVPGDFSRQDNSAKVQGQQSSSERSEQGVWDASPSTPGKPKSNRDDDFSSQSKIGDKTQLLSVHDAASKVISPLPLNNTDEDKQSDLDPRANFETNLKGTVYSPEVVQPHFDKKLPISVDDSSLALREVLEDEAVTQDLSSAETEVSDESQSLVSPGENEQQVSPAKSDFLTVQGSNMNSRDLTDKVAAEDLTSMSNSEDTSNRHDMQGRVVSPAMEAFQISQTPFPGIETIALPEVSQTTEDTEQQDVLPKAKVVSIPDPARDASLSDGTKSSKEDSWTVKHESISNEGLIEDNPKENQLVSESLLHLPPSNFVLSTKEHDVENLSEAKSKSMHAREMNPDEGIRELVPTQLHDHEKDDEKMSSSESAALPGFMGAERPSMRSTTRQKTERQSRVPNAELISMTPETLDACEKGRMRLVQRQYQAAITFLSQSIRQYQAKSLSRAQRPRLRDCYRQRAYTFFQLGDFPQALSDMNHVLEDSKASDQHRSRDFFFRGRVYTAVTDAQRAIEDLSKALALGLSTHEQAIAHYLRGLSYLWLHRLQPGLKDLSIGCRAEHAEACELLEKIL